MTTESMDESAGKPEFDPTTITRPDPALLRYYIFASLLTGPVSPIVLLPLWFRYYTLQYKFDDSGVSMRWGILFRKEVYLTYRRLQDIHLTRNVLQRWMGLAKISLQTASGSSQAEMVVEGILQAEELRDYLYSQMRGAKNPGSQEEVSKETLVSADGQKIDTTAADADRVTVALTEIRDAMQTLVDQNRGGQS
ncbi:MAG: hypothetical protein Aurels2KO_35760 [Aureliella sp.]